MRITEIPPVADLTAYVDLSENLQIWEDYDDDQRPHGSLKGNAPDEILREKLSDGQKLSYKA